MGPPPAHDEYPDHDETTCSECRSIALAPDLTFKELILRYVLVPLIVFILVLYGSVFAMSVLKHSTPTDPQTENNWPPYSAP